MSFLEVLEDRDGLADRDCVVAFRDYERGHGGAGVECRVRLGRVPGLEEVDVLVGERDAFVVRSDADTCRAGRAEVCV